MGIDFKKRLKGNNVMNPTEEQQKVIDCKSGALMVSACPGSGKTATLVKRTISLPKEESSMVLAFNSEAAKEFKKRLGKTNSKVMTFHAFCYREILKNPDKYGFLESFDSLWEGGLFALVKAACGLGTIRSWQQAGFDDELMKHCASSVYDSELKCLIESTKPTMSDDEYSDLQSSMTTAIVNRSSCYSRLKAQHEEEKQKRIEYRTYLAVRTVRKFCLDYGFLTFDDMVRLVAENRHELIDMTEHIMIDEFQDVDRFQFDIIEVLGKGPKVKSVAVVGDPNQTIYEWRGALRSSFGTFKKCFPETLDLKMTKNFRSKDEIIDFSEDICSVGMTGVNGSGGVVLLKERLNIVKDFLSNGSDSKYNDYAILHRTNKDVESSKKTLIENKIPFFVIGKSSKFWEQKHVKMAVRQMERDQDIFSVYQSDEWLTLTKKKKYRDNHDAVKELKEDVSFVFDLDIRDIDSLKRCTQNLGGVVLSTMHRTKGMEWKNVLLVNVNDYLMGETFLYYVACTRAKEVLMIDLKGESNNVLCKSNTRGSRKRN